MRLVGQDVLTAAGKKNPPLRQILAVWAKTVEQSKWESIADVRKTYPSADGVRLRSKVIVTVFNVKGNEYRLLSVIDYDTRFVEVLDIMTHHEYDKNLWKQRY